MNDINIVTREYLRDHPECIFVFGDNIKRVGSGPGAGAAELRNEPNTYGFITKRYPNNSDRSFFRPSEQEWQEIFIKELNMLKTTIELNPNKTFLISKLGAGRANRYSIWEETIHPELMKLRYPNVKLLWLEDTKL